MIETGYGAVSTRKVAQRASLTAPLVHYYYKSTDDLLVAVYRRAAERSHSLQAKALAVGGLPALCDAVSDRTRMQLAIEFMALANHRPAIKAEISRSLEAVRAAQHEAIEREFARNPDTNTFFTPLALTVIAAGIGQALVMEEGVGITLGHDETRDQMRAFIEYMLPAQTGTEHIPPD